MTFVLTVGGIADAHAVARSRGAKLIHVRTHTKHSMLPPENYAEVIDLTSISPEIVTRVTYVLERLPEQMPEAILCLHDDSVILGAHLAEHLGLPFPSISTAEATVDKARMRERLHGTHLGTVAHGTVSGGCVHWFTSRALGSVVLKPGHGRASIGVQILPDAAAVDRLVATRSAEYDGYVVEERKLGTEYSVESILTSAGEWHGVTAKMTQEAIEIGHLHPAPLDSERESTVKNVAVDTLRALGVNRGLLHTEVILDENGAAHVVETHLRGGGDGILDLVQFATGLNLTELYVDDVLGRTCEGPRPDVRGFASIQYSLPATIGTVVGWEGIEQARGVSGVTDVGVLPAVGDFIGNGPQSSYTRLAWAIATGSDPDTAQQQARVAANSVHPRCVGGGP